MLKTNLKRLKETYEKKNDLLEQLLQLENSKKFLLGDKEFSVEKFDDTMNQQDELLNQLSSLENTVVDMMKDLETDLEVSKDLYLEEKQAVKAVIGEMNQKIKELSDLESMNQLNLKKQMEIEKENLKLGRRSSKAALDYYKNMSGSHVVPPHFMDQKQ